MESENQSSEEKWYEWDHKEDEIVYLLWENDPHQEMTNVVNVYREKSKAEYAKLCLEKNPVAFAADGSRWYYYDIEERVIL